MKIEINDETILQRIQSHKKDLERLKDLKSKLNSYRDHSTFDVDGASNHLISCVTKDMKKVGSKIDSLKKMLSREFWNRTDINGYITTHWGDL
jgi:hypothetical protein